jgi:hypothetical protein
MQAYEIANLTERRLSTLTETSRKSSVMAHDELADEGYGKQRNPTHRLHRKKHI